MNQIIGVIIAIILAIGLVLWWTNDSDTLPGMNMASSTATTTENDDSQNGNDVPPNYQSIEDEDRQVSLFIPEEASVDTPTEDMVEVTYREDDDGTATTTEPGFVFSVRRDNEVATDQTLEAYAEAQVAAVEALDLSVLDSLTAMRVGNAPTFSYEYVPEDTTMASSTRVMVFMPEPGTAFTVDYSITGESTGDESFEEMIQTMVNSLRFTESME